MHKKQYNRAENFVQLTQQCTIIHSVLKAYASRGFVSDDFRSRDARTREVGVAVTASTDSGTPPPPFSLPISRLGDSGERLNWLREHRKGGDDAETRRRSRPPARRARRYSPVASTVAAASDDARSMFSLGHGGKIASGQ